MVYSGPLPLEAPWSINNFRTQLNSHIWTYQMAYGQYLNQPGVEGDKRFFYPPTTIVMIYFWLVYSLMSSTYLNSWILMCKKIVCLAVLSIMEVQEWSLGECHSSWHRNIIPYWDCSNKNESSKLKKISHHLCWGKLKNRLLNRTDGISARHSLKKSRSTLIY